MTRHFLDQLVEQAVSRFSLQARLEKHAIQPQHRWHPDIAISRDPGSGGRVVAKKIARKLGWELLDKQILTKLADELHIPPREFAKVDEHTRNWFADSWNVLFNPHYVSDVRYLKHLRQLLLDTARDGDVVIVGRGANHIIPPDKCLRVKITASFAKRVKNTVKHEKKTYAQAEAWVKYVQNKRHNFIRQYFGKIPSSPDDFDLIVSTDNLTLLQTRDLIIQAYLAKFPEERRRLKDKL